VSNKSNQNEETNETQWDDTKKIVTTIANEVVGFEERKQRGDWYDEECQINV
jgi:hypothetical protein